MRLAESMPKDFSLHDLVEAGRGGGGGGGGMIAPGGGIIGGSPGMSVKGGALCAMAKSGCIHRLV